MQDDNLLERITQAYTESLVDFTDKQSCVCWKKRRGDMDNGMSPLFTFIMCVYNDTSLFSQAVSSLLRQDFQNWELLILDNSDANPDAWLCIENATSADDRIYGVRSQQNVGWAKGMALLLEKAKGEYVTFLSADDCVLPGTLTQVAHLAQEGIPDIIWVGNAWVLKESGKDIELLETQIPEEFSYQGGTHAEMIVRVMENTYYNAMFHYSRRQFLFDNGIDFFSPYYGDCAGMTKALCAAESMRVCAEPVYLLTTNTSQTAGYYIWDSGRTVFGRQWELLRQVFAEEGYRNSKKVYYVAARIYDNLVGNIGLLCSGRCRDKYMNPLEKTTEEIIGHLEETLEDANVKELLSMADAGKFTMFLGELGKLSTRPDVNLASFSGCWSYPLLCLAVLGDTLSSRERLDYVVRLLLAEKNTNCIGYPLFEPLLNECTDEVLGAYMPKLEAVLDKYEAYILDLQGTFLGML